MSAAGSAAIAEDASTVYYNPAGITFLKRPEILLVAPAISLSNGFENGGTRAPLGEPARGAGDNKDQVFLLPSLFATMPLSNRVSVGLGLFIPFGQANEYDDNWVGRYQLQSISLKTLDIDPVVAYRISDSFSVGVGTDIQYAHLKRNSAIDFGVLCFNTIGPADCSGLGLLPQGADGRFTANVEDWKIGFNFGALYNFGDSTHIGFNYRSAVRHDFSGAANFDVPAAVGLLTASGLFQDTSLRTSVTFPEVIAVGLSQEIDDRLTVLIDVDWTGWSRFKQATLNFQNPLQPSQTLSFNWRDSMRFAVGGIYHLSNDTDLRAGVSYDQSAMAGNFRGADLPDSDAMMFSAGLMRQFNDRFSTTISYSYGHHVAAPVDLSMPLAGTLIGTFHRTSHALGLDLRVRL